VNQRSIISLGIFMVGAILGIYLGLQLLPLASSTATPTAQENPTGEAAYLEGRLTEVSYPLPATWTLDEELYPPQVWSLEVLSTTEVITNGLEPVEGTWARVDAISIESSLEATRITLSPYPRPVTIEGQLTQVSSSSPGRWVLEYYPFQVNEGTLIIANDLVAEPGTYVRAELLKLPDGRWARSVELLIPAGQPGPAVELADWLVDMDESAGRWQVGSRTVLVDESTVVEGPVDVGSLLRVRGSRVEGDLLAQLIQVLPAEDGVVFQGIINAVSDSVWMVDDVTVLVDEDTIQSGLPARPGMWVQVQGQQIDAFTVRAAYVWVDEAGPRQLVAWLQTRDDDEEPELWQIGLIDGPETRSVFLEVGADVVVLSLIHI
jgi:hypothetical protein